MPLLWNEIRSRATAFAQEWANAANEDAEAKSFWDAFFNVFGMSRRKLAAFEKAVDKLNDRKGYIDLFWPGTLLVEHKSRGKDLDSAYQQGLEYFQGLKDSELPRYLIVSDFARIRLYDLDEPDTEKRAVTIALEALPQHVELFGFIAGFQKTHYKDQDPVNIEAAERLGKLHDFLEAQNYRGKPLEIFMTRVLFCLFAEDTGIFNKYQFEDYVVNHTAEDGKDLGAKLHELFIVLDKPETDRQLGLDDDLKAFPYVNGGLFESRIDPPFFNTEGRETLLYCADFDWSKVSPAIFGSLFQSVMNKVERRSLGAHYTSEKNILKVVSALFLDDLRAEFEKVKGTLGKLRQFHKKLSELTFLDPACGSGNFLIITYRELRRLEIEVLTQEAKLEGRSLDTFLEVRDLSKVTIQQLYGIEIDEFSSKVAEVALWMVDHQMNTELGAAFQQYYANLPLRHSPHIVHANALRIDWASVIPPAQLSYLLGNPPFVGSKLLDAAQRADVAPIIASVKGGGVLDYVCMWFIKAAHYIRGTQIRAAFVSTNSISQGEQVGILWDYLYRQGLKIHFAHRTFKWSNEAKGNAAVYCIITGFAAFDIPQKRLFDYETVTSEPQESLVANINPYLVEGEDIIIEKRNKPLCKVPRIKFGNQPIDGGGLILSEDEFKQISTVEPLLKDFVKLYIGSYEFINNQKRYCLWLKDAPPKIIRSSKIVSERLAKVKAFRLESERPDTQKLAETPYLFAFISHPSSSYIFIPSASSEKRNYIPIGLFSNEIIASNLALIIPNGTIFELGILSSSMHMAWVRSVCGRLKSDYRYSNSVVYNNYPWPKAPTAAQKAKVEAAAQAVLDARAKYPDSSLADLYDPLTMPKPLLEAHKALDKAVDACYRKEPFATERERVQFLFRLYQEYTADLFSGPAPKKTRRKKADA